MPGSDPKALVQRLWDFCDVLRDDGLSYGDYLEQLTYLPFLKMADEQHELLGGERVVPIGYDWQSLLACSDADLEAHYSQILSELGAGDDMLGVVFGKARNRIQTPAKLERLIKDFIDIHGWCLPLDHRAVHPAGARPVTHLRSERSPAGKSQTYHPLSDSYRFPKPSRRALGHRL